MSLFINTFVKNSLYPSLRFVTPCRSFHITPIKYLYAPEALGIDGYLQTRKRCKEQFANFIDKFRTKMNEFTANSNNMIFTEDLKNMIHLAEPADLDLILKMIKKFNTQQSEYRFGSYIFGPVVMRMFHFMDAPQQALECFYDERNDGFFDQLISYHILLDLLYCHERYDDMFKVFDTIQKKQLNMTKFPKYSVVLIMAACYKQNTPQSLEHASKIWTEMNNSGVLPVRRACAYFAGLALKQGVPHIAVESISTQKQHYVTIRNIKAMALADLGRVEDALAVLRTVLDIDKPSEKDKHTFFAETVEKVRAAVEKSDSKDLKKEFDHIHKAFIDRSLIDEKTLDLLLNSEIRGPKQDPLKGTLYQNKKMPFGVRSRPRRTLL